MKEVEAVAKHGRGTGSGAGEAKPSKFDGTASWVVFWRQFETAAKNNCWARQEKFTYLITGLQGPATDVLQETLEDLEDCFGNQYLAAAYRSQLNSRTQDIGDSLQECGKAIEQLAHSTYPHTT
jgi:hypothetical protein